MSIKLTVVVMSCALGAFSIVGCNSEKAPDSETIVEEQVDSKERKVVGADVSGNITVSDNIYFDSSDNNLYVNQSNIYFNGCKLNKCEGNVVVFYLASDYNDTNITELESNIQSELLVLNSDIDFTDLEFTFTNV